ncbi:MAG: phosphate transporter substrate-binding protein [Paenibacillus sp.]|nr:phosphate transporter substrate-binding protein [Paenibacillus sp.]
MWKLFSGKMASIAMVGVLSVGVLAGCGQSGDNKTTGSAPAGGGTPAKVELTGTVSASGSTALQPLVSKAAQDFMAKNPKVTVNVTGGGSGTGVKNVVDGVSDIGNSDVEADAQYKDKLADNIVVIAPFALIVNKASVGVTNLTKVQAADIFAANRPRHEDVHERRRYARHKQDGSRSCCVDGRLDRLCRRSLHQRQRQNRRSEAGRRRVFLGQYQERQIPAVRHRAHVHEKRQQQRSCKSVPDFHYEQGLLESTGCCRPRLPSGRFA